MPIGLVMPSNYIIFCHPILHFPQSFSAWVFLQWVNSVHQIPKVLELHFQHVLQMNVQGWFPLELTRLLSLLSKVLSSIFSSITIWKHQFFGAQFSLWSNSHILHDNWKKAYFDYMNLCLQCDVSAFNMLCSFTIAFLPKSKHLLISWLQSPSAVILEPSQNEVCHCFQCFPIYLPWSDGTRCHDLSFLNVEF